MIFKFTLICIFQLICFFGVNAQYGTISFLTSSDTHVEGGTSNVINFGNETSLKVKRISDESTIYNRKAFLQFDLSTLKSKNIGKVTLRMYCNSLTGSGFSVDIFKVAANWDEYSLNWNNAPVLSTKLKTFYSPAVAAVWSEVDFTDIVSASAGFPFAIGLSLSGISNTNYVLWNSKEAVSNKPELQIVFKANKPSAFTSKIGFDTSTELRWDTTACNADEFKIERRRLDNDLFELVATVKATSEAIFVDELVNNLYSYVYRLTAVNTGGIDAEPLELRTVGTKTMEYVSSTSEQPNVDPVLAGTSDNPLLRVKIQTLGSQSAVVVNSFQVNTEGTTNTEDMKNIKIFYTGADSIFANPVLYSVAGIPVVSGEMMLSGEQILNESMNYFWLTCSVDSKAQNNNIVDAQCTQIALFSSDLEIKVPEVVNPDGARRVVRFLTPSRKFEFLNRALVAVASLMLEEYPASEIRKLLMRIYLFTQFQQKIN